MKVLYVNAYGVTRHFGGSEEGGWWYNAGQGLASVPVQAREEPGCEPGTCTKCDKARETYDGGAIVRKSGEENFFCEEEIDDSEVQGAFYDWLAYGGVKEEDRSVLRIAFNERKKNAQAEGTLNDAGFYASVFYFQACKTVSHTVPVDDAKVETVKALLIESLGHVEHGDIFSVLGGEKLEIRIEEGMAADWSDYRPYE